ncbi:ribosomal RNA-processing protein 7 homolog A [Thrips palmi]|uniref:Ribosomal RNA-processing protein 7 homolog A n=1 Tax=Thrips palmi TaxID=161013 RepID=A0A6P8YHL4_THRPL|nr:ribosomal RNA-processing protein 7 homolog A [Thrips palmi]
MDKLKCPLGLTALYLKYSSESSGQHMIFVKQHAVRERHPDKPSDRTLFMLNIPPYCTEESLKFAWRECGAVKAVFFHSKPSASVPLVDESPFFPTHEVVKGFKVAYVVFEKPEGLMRALNWNQDQPLILSSSESPLLCGTSKWCTEYNARIPDVNAMKEDVDSYMAAYDKKVQKEIEKEKAEGEEDEDGWITVSKRGRNPGFARTENKTKKILANEDKKRSKKELLNIYSFQIREAKMKNLMTLRQKFEEDKKKIQMLKTARKFKPF